MANFKIAALGGVLALVLAGCGGGSSGRSGSSAAITAPSTAPLQIGRTGGAATTANMSVLGPLDETLIRRAIETYRISKKRAKGSYQLAGADLNGDGVREAIVLFQGKDWCTKTGCSMTVFQSFQHGFRPISRTVRVKAPVEVTAAMTNAYHDLLVQTGGGPAPERRVRLIFSGSEYSRNAMLQTEVPLGSVVRTEIVIAETPVPESGTAAR